MEEHLKRKYEALERFRERLLSTPQGKYVAKLFLHGSVLRGEAEEGSDVDVLVIASDALPEVEEAALESSFETALELGELVEPMVYCLDALRYPPSLFVYQGVKEGKEVYSMDESTLKREEAKGYLALAEEYRRGAENSLRSGDYRLCVDAAYNACELCAKGLLLFKLAKLPATHSGVVLKFGEFFVKEGALPRELGRELNRALWLRNRACYDPHVEVTEEDGRRMLELADKLIEALREHLVEA